MLKKKSQLLLITTALLTGILFFQFKPKEAQFFDTNLRITIQDDLGNVLEGATVTLFANNEDYRSSSNPIAGPLLTDKKGRVTFKELESKVYYLYAEKGKMNNNMLGVKTEKLEEDKLNKIAIVIQ